MWATRRATDADVPALRDLCTASVGPDDYVLAFLDRFVRESVTLIALDGSRTIGMMVYDDIPDGSVWLHAARTHPDYRRQGVATELNRACAELARSRGRESLRLWADASNLASVGAARREGFEERARFARMRVDASRASRNPQLGPVDLDRDWPTLESSRLLQLGSGFVFYDFYFLPFTRTNAQWLERQGALLRVNENAVCVSEDFEDAWGKDLQIQPLAGDLAAILDAAAAVARSRGADRVESFLPNDAQVLALARGAGFELMEWGREAILFEKPLPPGPRRGGGTRPAPLVGMRP